MLVRSDVNVAMYRLTLMVLCIVVSVYGVKDLKADDDVPTVIHDVVYGHKDGLAMTYDVINPAPNVKSNGAAVIFVISGGWKSRWFPAERFLDPTRERTAIIRELLDDGYHIVVLRHGSSPKYNVLDAAEDVKAAIRHLHKNSRDMGIDPERMGVFGFSAGGHLSLILGTMGGNETPNWLNKVRAKRREATDKAESPSDYEVTAPVAAVVAWFAPCDLQTVAGPSLRFPALDIDPNRAEEVSPALHVDTGDAPTMLFHGTQDIVCPVVSSRFMHGALTSAEVPTEIKIYEGQGHGFNGDPERESAEMAKAWFDRWLLKTRSSTPDQN